MSQQAMQQALDALLDVRRMLQRWDAGAVSHAVLAAWFKLSFGGAGTFGNQLHKAAIAVLEKELALHTTGAAGQIVYADKIAFESAMREGKGCDVWPKAGDYTARTGRALVALQVLAPPAIEANDAKDAVPDFDEWWSNNYPHAWMRTEDVAREAWNAAMSTHQPKEKDNADR